MFCVYGFLHVNYQSLKERVSTATNTKRIVRNITSNFMATKEV